MKQYLDLLREVWLKGQREPNRTGIDTFTLPGAMLKFDLREGFPAVTTKKLAWKQVVGELIGFLRGTTSAKNFRDLGCTIWDQNANENLAWVNNPNRQGEDDLGRVYGAQWRSWPNTCIEQDPTYGAVFSDRPTIDQIALALDKVRNDPSNRRIIVTAWNPAELDKMALPPCHMMFQLLPRSDGTLHMTMYQRSCDMFLGVPFNIASYALLLHLFAAWSGRQAATLTMFLADVHIYENHLEQVQQQLNREPMPLPVLEMELPPNVKHASLEALVNFLKPGQFNLLGYHHHQALKAPMAV